MARPLPTEGTAPLEPSKGVWRAILALPLITLVPVVVFAVATVVFLAHQQRSALEREIVQLARQSIRAADLLLEERLATLDVLASLASEPELDGYSQHARRLLRSRPDWRAVALHQTDGTRILGESRPGEAAEALPADPAAADALPFARVVQGPDRAPALLLQMATTRPDGTMLLATAALDLEPFSRALEGLADPEWTVAILDPNHVIAGRSRAPSRFVGATATASLVSEIEGAQEHFFYATNQEGDRVYTAFSRSQRTGWTAAIGAPAQLVEAPLQRARRSWFAGGTLAVALAGVFGWLLVRNIVARQAAERRAWQLESERRSEARLSEIARHFPGVMYRRVLHPDGEVSFPYLSQGVEDLLGEHIGTGLSQPRSLDDLARKYVLAEDRPAIREAIRNSAENLTSYGVETRINRSDGQLRWIRSAASTRRTDDGSIVWDGVMMDITPLKLTESALKAKTEILQTINRVNIQIASELNRENIVLSLLDAGRNVFGVKFGAFFHMPHEPRTGLFRLYRVSGATPETLPALPVPLGEAFGGAGTVRLDDLAEDRDGEVLRASGLAPPESDRRPDIRSCLATPVVSRSGEVMGALLFADPAPGMFNREAEEIVSGIAAQAAVALENARLFKAAEDELVHRREIEAQQKVLLAELNHRVKNTLAVVLAIAQQTAKTSPTTERFNEVFHGRIMALANAHSLLTAGEWRSTSLRALIETALEPYAELDGERASVSGPEVVAPPKQALALSLVFHELATNASKYGALSPAGGRVQVEWEPAGPCTLLLTWRESTRTGVKMPEREGFGSKLIAMTVEREMGGSVRRDFAANGFVAEIRLPWRAQTSELSVGDVLGTEEAAGNVRG